MLGFRLCQPDIFVSEQMCLWELEKCPGNLREGRRRSCPFLVLSWSCQVKLTMAFALAFRSNVQFFSAPRSSFMHGSPGTMILLQQGSWKCNPLFTSGVLAPTDSIPTSEGLVSAPQNLFSKLLGSNGLKSSLCLPMNF